MSYLSEYYLCLDDKLSRASCLFHRAYWLDLRRPDEARVKPSKACHPSNEKTLKGYIYIKYLRFNMYDRVQQQISCCNIIHSCYNVSISDRLDSVLPGFKLFKFISYKIHCFHIECIPDRQCRPEMTAENRQTTHRQDNHHGNHRTRHTCGSTYLWMTRSLLKSRVK